MPVARIPSFAKLNLSLRVLHKRPDGFHELRSVFQTISICDWLTVQCERARATVVELDSNIDIPDNIVLKAAHAALEATRTKARVRLSLDKRIPMGGGLGGGSSNAAAVLRAVPALLGRTPDPELLVTLGARLGSDVPFFLLGGTALGLGRGEELYPLPEPAKSAHGVLVLSGIHVSTPEAYRALGRSGDAEPAEAVRFATRGWAPIAAATPFPSWGDFCSNDFEEVVFRLHPELNRIRRRLVQLGASPARMTGSGSAIFGFFPSRAEAVAAAARIAGSVPFHTLSRHRYQHAWDRAMRGNSAGLSAMMAGAI